MKFIAPSNELLQHLMTVQGAIIAKPIVPILENFLFDIKKGQLTIFSTDLETSMTTSMQVEAKEDIKVAMPSRMLSEILRSLPDQPVTFNVDEDNFSIEVVNNTGRYKMAGQDGVDFPTLPEKSNEGSFVIPSNVLLRAVSKTLFATGNDDMRLNLTGLFVQILENAVNFVATDANKLVKFQRADINPGFEQSFIIPKRPLNLLKSTLPNNDTPVQVDFNKTNVFFTFGNTQLICRLLDEKYPDYQAVIPTNNPNVLTINRSDFYSAINRISLFSNKATQQIRLKVTGNELLISAEDIENANEGQERLSCEFEGEDMEIGFNARYLKEMLSTIDGDQVKLAMSQPNRAGLLLPVEDERNESITMLIMPMMLNNY